MIKRSMAVAALAVLPFAAVACGGDDDGGGGNTRQQIIDQMTEGGDGPSDEQAGCMADGIIASLGEDRAKELLEAGDVEIDEALSPDEQTKFAELALACVDARAMIIEQLTASGFSDDDATCVIDALDDDQLQAMVEAGMAGGEPDQAALVEAVMGCGITP